MTIRDVPMFDVPPPAALTLSRLHARAKTQRGTYSAYNPKGRVACDECVAVLHEAAGKGEPPRGARVSRRTPGGQLRLCTGHAELWKTMDGIGGR